MGKGEGKSEIFEGEMGRKKEMRLIRVGNWEKWRKFSFLGGKMGKKGKRKERWKRELFEGENWGKKGKGGEKLR